jgi:hypothetical protein
VRLSFFLRVIQEAWEIRCPVGVEGKLTVQRQRTQLLRSRDVKGKKPRQAIQAKGLEEVQCIQEDEHGPTFHLVRETVEATKPLYKVRKKETIRKPRQTRV